MRGRTVRTVKKRTAFLEVLKKGWSVEKACRAAKMSRDAAYSWRNDDPDFRKDWDEAIDEGTDRLEDEAARRGTQGTLRPVYQGGQMVGKIREYSDTLLIFTLKARRPNKFRDNAVPIPDKQPLKELLAEFRERNKAIENAQT